MVTQEPLSAFLMTTFLSSATDLTAFHSSWDKISDWPFSNSKKFFLYSAKKILEVWVSFRRDLV